MTPFGNGAVNAALGPLACALYLAGCRWQRENKVLHASFGSLAKAHQTTEADVKKSLARLRDAGLESVERVGREVRQGDRVVRRRIFERRMLVLPLDDDFDYVAPAELIAWAQAELARRARGWGGARSGAGRRAHRRGSKFKSQTIDDHESKPEASESKSEPVTSDLNSRPSANLNSEAVSGCDLNSEELITVDVHSDRSANLNSPEVEELCDVAPPSLLRNSVGLQRARAREEFKSASQPTDPSDPTDEHQPSTSDDQPPTGPRRNPPALSSVSEAIKQDSPANRRSAPNEKSGALPAMVLGGVAEPGDGTASERLPREAASCTPGAIDLYSTVGFYSSPTDAFRTPLSGHSRGPPEIRTPAEADDSSGCDHSES